MQVDDGRKCQQGRQRGAPHTTIIAIQKGGTASDAGCLLGQHLKTQSINGEKHRHLDTHKNSPCAPESSSASLP